MLDSKKIAVAHRYSILILCVFITELATAQSWYVSRTGNAGQTGYYPTTQPDFVGDTFEIQTLNLSAPIRTKRPMLVGDVDGDGNADAVFAAQESPNLLILDLVIGNSYLVPLMPNSFTNGMESEFFKPIQLIDYDNEPGLEVVIASGLNNNRHPILYQVVSVCKNQALASFWSTEYEDVDGDGMAAGQSNLQLLFRDIDDKWKAIVGKSQERPDLQPRKLEIYDVGTGNVDASFTTATPNINVSATTVETGETYIIVAPSTPDNELPSGENVSAIVDGTLITDAESYVKCFQFDSRNTGSPLSLRWKHKRGELLSGWSMITENEQGREVAITVNQYIRIWDFLTPDSLRVYDLFNGEILWEYFLEETFSFNYAVFADQTNDLYAIAAQEPQIMKFDISLDAASNPVASISFPDEQVSTLTPLGITDMDGDGKHDLVVSRNTGEQNYVHIYSANLEEMAIIPTPLSRRAGFADADQDGYPELYIADETTGLSVTVIEYQRTSSHIDGFERLR